MLCLLFYTLCAGRCPPGQTIRIPEGTTSIADRQYEYCVTVDTLIMPDTVTSIGALAFDTNPIKKVTLSKNLISIGYAAFRNAGFEEIVIPDGVTVLNQETFYGCSSLKKVTLPKNLKSIHTRCFGKTIVEELVFPYGLQYIGYEITEENRCLKRVVIPDSCTSIIFYAFAGCSGLQEIILPKGIKALNESLFSGTALRNCTIPDTVEIIGPSCFSRTDLKTISIPPKVIQIGKNAFYKCWALESITFEGNNLKEIGQLAFSHCGRLKRLTFPSSLVNVSMDVCEECNVLRTVVIQCDLKAFVYYGDTLSYGHFTELKTLVYESNTPIPERNNFSIFRIQTLIINNSNLESMGDIPDAYRLSTIVIVDPSSKFTFSPSLRKDITLNISISRSIKGFTENVFENVSIDTFIYCGKSISDNSFLKNSKGFKKVITSSAFRGETIGGVKISEKTDQCTQLIPFEVKYQEESGSEEPEKTNEPEKSSPATASSNNNNQDNSGGNNEENDSSKDGKGKGKGGKIAGGIIGAILILAAIAVIAFFIYKYKIHKSENDSEEQHVELSLV
ncbi:surface antigen Bsp, putative [Trichomonas vaginalis G3]|uniref:Surface antigen Bsp, putative n=1 Tax=Trichomonas vaginalis (strain ATCC PRA-98 / G3) TaxID=412133 RepID=A2FR21_TRIV3|nr:ribonuclease inhibitor domain-containing protein [Trichomonas vaginalis G3]EAX92651.1 surface antigen Bsp, putative [Trichomonas vaginalis G3]KAI5535701.1 ribonuclease inhibitor domain-containing protein [Trichomonas vaginalis G3]|eukprot:XP_001305581.1 surface antigen Bsp [Trichomonas vaginalis G3]